MMQRQVALKYVVWSLVWLAVVAFWLTPFAAAQRRSGGRGRITPETAASLGLGIVPAFDELPNDPPLDVSLAWGTSVPTVPAKVVRYAEIILEHYDKNGDGVWQRHEWEKLHGAPQAVDVDGDLEVTLEELVRAFVAYGHGRTIHRPLRPEPIQHAASAVKSTGTRRLFQPVSTNTVTTNNAALNTTVANLDSDMTDAAVTAAAELSPEEIIAAEQQVPAERRYHTHREELAGVPAWFLLRDKNGDGQISIVEFAPQLSAAALALFGQLDQDGNGLISPQEAKPRQ